MTIESLVYLFERDLNRLYTEIESYPDERLLWKVLPGSTNSGGNLVLHLIGNLNHFIGHIIGKTDYKRDRENEFSAKDIARVEILKGIENCKKGVIDSLRKFDIHLAQEDFPVQVFQDTFSNEQMIIHLAGHLNYHLGQINYHRRYFSEFN